MPKPTTLSCGGKGPCCHVGYSHRHCEHCDMVIDTRAFTYIPYINPLPYYPSAVRPYIQPFFGSGTITYNANTTGAAGGANFANTHSFNTPPSAQVCAALPSGD